MRHMAMMAAAFVGSLGLATLVWAGENVQLSELPAQVRQTVEREAKGAAINEIERDTEEDRVIYEVELTRGGERWEIDVDAYGKVIDRHRD